MQTVQQNGVANDQIGRLSDSVEDAIELAKTIQTLIEQQKFSDDDIRDRSELEINLLRKLRNHPKWAALARATVTEWENQHHSFDVDATTVCDHDVPQQPAPGGWRPVPKQVQVTVPVTISMKSHVDQKQQRVEAYDICIGFSGSFPPPLPDADMFAHSQLRVATLINIGYKVLNKLRPVDNGFDQEFLAKVFREGEQFVR